MVRNGDDITQIIIDSLGSLRSPLRRGDVVVVASKVLAVAEGRVVDLKKAHPTRKALKLSQKYDMDPSHVQVILDESDSVLGGIDKTLITLKDDVLIANGGVDKSNAPDGHVIIWPSNPDAWALKIRRAIRNQIKTEIGVIVADSRVHPLRIGTIGCAIGISGIDPLREYRGVIDLYGKPLLISRLAVADDLASAAHVLMGEAAERVGLVVIRDPPVMLSEEKNSKDLVIEPENCLFMGSIFKYPKKLVRSKRRTNSAG
jgi:coenzyme F420-0:L-glutamate ligase